jgi:A/G-specific adenine glycosylase
MRTPRVRGQCPSPGTTGRARHGESVTSVAISDADVAGGSDLPRTLSAAALEDQRVFRRVLAEWWKANARSFPWRETRDPYSVLVAELLLQKTPWYKVVRLYQSFLERYPSARELAVADVEDVRALISPLGLPKRAATLVALADALERSHGGDVPSDTAQLRRLPGVGEYTANAVQCFAFGRSRPLVDEVAARVYRRFFGLPARKRAYEDRALWSFVEDVLPRREARDFALAVLDFASLVCTHRAPRCPTCPLRARCASYLTLREGEHAREEEP